MSERLLVPIINPNDPESAEAIATQRREMLVRMGIPLESLLHKAVNDLDLADPEVRREALDEAVRAARNWANPNYPMPD